MNAHHQPNEPPGRPGLSPAGAARRDTMLGELLGELERLHAARRTRRTVAAVMALALVAAGSLWVTLPSRAPTRHDVARRTPEAPAVIVTVQAIDDDQLLTALAELGRPTGLVRTGDRVWVTEQVTDADLGIQWHRNDS